MLPLVMEKAMIFPPIMIYLWKNHPSLLYHLEGLPTGRGQDQADLLKDRITINVHLLQERQSLEDLLLDVPLLGDQSLEGQSLDDHIQDQPDLLDLADLLLTTIHQTGYILLPRDLITQDLLPIGEFTHQDLHLIDPCTTEKQLRRNPNLLTNPE